MVTGTSGCGAGAGLCNHNETRKLYILLILFVLCALFYYFGELVDLARWTALRWDIFYTVHDVHRLLFLVPIVFAAYFFGVKAALIITLLAFATFLFRALFISPFPDPLLRTIVFIIIGGTVGYLTGSLSQQRKHLKTMAKSQSDTMLQVLDRTGDGSLVIGPDYRIRRMNETMRGRFGEGVGSYCYEYLYKSREPCQQICRLTDVINGATDERKTGLRDGRTYKLSASPYIDSDGAACQLVVFTETGRQPGMNQNH